MFKFGQALVIAVILGAFAWYQGQLGAQRIMLLVFYLLLAAIVPWLMVPLGVILVLWDLLNTNQLSSWIKSFGQKGSGHQLTQGVQKP